MKSCLDFDVRLSSRESGPLVHQVETINEAVEDPAPRILDEVIYEYAAVYVYKMESK